MLKRLLFIVGLLALVVGMAREVRADGGINLRTQSDFAGILTGSSPLFTGLMPNNPTDPNTIAVSEKYADFSSSGPSTALNTNPLFHFLQTAPVSNNTVGIAAALYRYPTDPDLTGYFAHLHVYIPQVSDGSATGSGIDTFSFALIDQSNLVRYWQFDDSVLTAGTNTFDIALFAGAPGFLPTHTDTNFDITKVDFVQMSYHGRLTDSFPTNPDPNASGGFWISDQELVVSITPEPSSLLALLMGALSVAAQSGLRRRKKP